MSRIELKTAQEIEEMRIGGQITAKIVKKLAGIAHSGVKTSEFDKLARSLCKEYKVESGTLGYKGYPSAVCISINDELVHGIPKENVILQDGDLLKIDMVVVYNGLFLDHAISIGVGEVSNEAQKMINVTKLSLDKAIEQCQIGKTTGDIGNVIQNIVELSGFNVTKQMTGHGVGHKMHEGPDVLCYGTKGEGDILQEGMTLAIEPMVLAGDWEVYIDPLDQWTVKSIDHKLTSHFEHTVAITKQGPLILTEE